MSISMELLTAMIDAKKELAEAEVNVERTLAELERVKAEYERVMVEYQRALADRESSRGRVSDLSTKIAKQLLPITTSVTSDSVGNEEDEAAVDDEWEVSHDSWTSLIDDDSDESVNDGKKKWDGHSIGVKAAEDIEQKMFDAAKPTSTKKSVLVYIDTKQNPASVRKTLIASSDKQFVGPVQVIDGKKVVLIHQDYVDWLMSVRNETVFQGKVHYFNVPESKDFTSELIVPIPRIPKDVFINYLEHVIQYFYKAGVINDTVVKGKTSYAVSVDYPQKNETSLGSYGVIKFSYTVSDEIIRAFKVYLTGLYYGGKSEVFDKVKQEMRENMKFQFNYYDPEHRKNKAISKA